MQVTLSTGQTLRISFAHSSHVATDPETGERKLTEKPNPGGTRKRIDGYSAEMDLRRLTLCEIAEVGYSGDATGQSDEKSYLVLGEGWGVCHPSDTFTKLVGRKIALAGALTAAGIEPDQRAEVWAAYFAQFPQGRVSSTSKAEQLSGAPLRY